MQTKMCFGCDHCEPHGFVRQLKRGKREIRMCRLHGIEVGESSMTCEDGTNKPECPKPSPRPAKSLTGWEDY